MKALRTLLRRPAILITVVVLVATGLAIGARAVTTALLGPGDTPVGADAGVDDGEVAAATTNTTSTTEAREQPASPTPTATSSTLVAPSTTPAPSESPSGVGLTIGEPTITPRQPVSFRNQVTVLPVVVTDFPSFPTRAPAEGGSGSGTGLVDRPDVTNEEAAPLPRAFNVGVLVEADSHFAVIRVGIDAGPEGLADLVVDFGDGEVLDVSQGRIDQVGDIGTIEIVHRYEPTLTPQPQEVTATATDGAGTVKTDSARFETQAEFLVSYSPLTVTALDDCDLFGKGDFELEWNNDGRDRRSTFDLGKGDTYVEEEFRVGVDARYGERVDFSISIAELDSLALVILRFVSGAYLDSGFIGPSAPGTDVMQLGDHTVPFTLEPENYEECDTRLEFTVTLALSEREPR